MSVCFSDIFSDVRLFIVPDDFSSLNVHNNGLTVIESKFPLESTPYVEHSGRVMMQLCLIARFVFVIDNSYTVIFENDSILIGISRYGVR